MIADVDKTLAAFLQQTLPQDASARAAISFANPAGAFPEGSVLPLINLFLCSLAQRDDLRDNTLAVQRQGDGTAQLVRPPVFLGATYLVSVWTDLKADADASQEHSILGALTAALLGTPVLPSETFQGSLTALGAGALTGRLVNTGLQHASTLSQTFGDRHKLTLLYEVTFPMPVFAPEQTPLVTSRSVRFRSITEQAPATGPDHA